MSGINLINDMKIFIKITGLHVNCLSLLSKDPPNSKAMAREANSLSPCRLEKLISANDQMPS